MRFPARTIATGDGNDHTDAFNSAYTRSGLPYSWLADKKMPPYRHLGGANYSFVDGHVRWLRPEELSDESPKAASFTFYAG
jgi:prepilin-type processing-associated H-X9-DG protein